MWYKAHYKEAEKIRARPLGEFSSTAQHPISHISLDGRFVEKTNRTLLDIQLYLQLNLKLGIELQLEVRLELQLKVKLEPDL